MWQVAFILLISLTLSAHAIKGFLIEKIEETRYATGGVEIKKVREFVTPKAFVREEKTIKSSMEGRRIKSTSINLLLKKGLLTYDIDHDKKQYTKFLISYETFSSLLSQDGLFKGLVVCNNNRSCKINENFYRLTGRKKKIGRWSAREVILLENGEKSVMWVVKDKELENAVLMHFKFYLRAIKRGSKGNMSATKVYDKAFKLFERFVRKYGAPVQTVSEDRTEGILTIETIKDVKKIDVPDSMLKPPKGYKEFKPQM